MFNRSFSTLKDRFFSFFNAVHYKINLSFFIQALFFKCKALFFKPFYLFKLCISFIYLLCQDDFFIVCHIGMTVCITKIVYRNKSLSCKTHSYIIMINES